MTAASFKPRGSQSWNMGISRHYNPTSGIIRIQVDESAFRKPFQRSSSANSWDAWSKEERGQVCNEQPPVADPVPDLGITQTISPHHQPWQGDSSRLFDRQPGRWAATPGNRAVRASDDAETRGCLTRCRQASRHDRPHLAKQSCDMATSSIIRVGMVVEGGLQAALKGLASLNEKGLKAADVEIKFLLTGSRGCDS